MLPDPDNAPKAFLTMIVAAGLLVFRSNVFGSQEAYRVADEFVSETERRFGSLNAKPKD